MATPNSPTRKVSHGHTHTPHKTPPQLRARSAARRPTALRTRSHLDPRWVPGGGPSGESRPPRGEAVIHRDK
eukprot:scaffold131301_cov63-Phaeocystis_antarctica.AAC.3